MEAQITDPSAPYYDAYQAAIFAETGATTLNQEQPQGEDENGEWEEGDDAGRKNGELPFWGNQQTMNINPLILTNVRNSMYYKSTLLDLKTYHEVVDQIYYKVTHLEPWEKGSRKTSGQTGMCGGVRGVGAGGIVSSAFCLLYKLSSLKLTSKQVYGLMNHADSPYIRGLGFMYVRFTQPPADLLEWFEDYLDDEEVIDVKAGGGKEITIGEMVKQFLNKLEWFDTRFPRIPVPVQKEITDYFEQMEKYTIGHEDVQEAEKNAKKEEQKQRSRDREAIPVRRDKDRRNDDRRSDKSRHDRKRSRSPKGGEKRRHQHGSSKHDHRRTDDRHKPRRSRSRDRGDRGGSGRSNHRHEDDYQAELKKFSEHRKKDKKHKRSRSKSRSRERDRRR